MKEFDKKDVVINDVDGDAVDALSADLADVVANQTDSVEEIQLSLSKKEKELDDSKQTDAKESADVAAADSGLADMIMAESQSTATSGQGGGAASADGGLSSNGKLLAVAGVVTAAGIAVAASDGDGGGSGGKNNQEFTVSIDSPTADEGDSGTNDLNFQVSLDEAPTSAVTFNYTVTGGTAVSGVDFDAQSGTITFAEGQTDATITVKVRGDVTFEADETVTLTVTGAQAGAAVSSTGTITNDDADPADLDYDLSVNAPTVVEGDNGTTVLRYELSLDRVPTEGVQVGFQTLATGTATAGTDFVADSGSVVFAAGQQTAIVEVVVNGDTQAEGNETVAVQFTGGQLSASVTATGTIVDDETVDSFFLTTGIDNATGELFISQPEYTPGGDDLVNTLQDEDVLTGTGVYNVLNATIGSISEEGTESEIAPTLINIQEVNLNINDDDVSRIDFQDADDVTNLNVVRMTDTGASITLDNLAAGTDEIGIESATSQGTINLLYREDELTALDNTLDLNVGQAGVVRLSMLNITETGDSAEDQGFGFETVNMTTESLTNIDNIFIAPNANEDRDNGTDQSFNLDANAETEINNLIANGVEFMSISAEGEVMIAADEDEVLFPLNDGIATEELQMLTIDGSANVTIDGLDGDIDKGTTGDAGDSADDTTLVVDASALTGDLTLGVATGADGESADANYEDRADKDLSVTSGSGDDTIKVYSNLAGDITTNDGNDTVVIGDAGLAIYNAAYNAALAGILAPTADQIAAANEAGLAAKNDPDAVFNDFDMEGVSTVDTGAGNDMVVAGDMGVTKTDADEDGNSGYDDVTAAKIITGDGNDSVTVGNLTNGQDWDNNDLNDANADDLYNIKAASISTGAGDDTVAFDMAAENAVVDTGADADTVNVELEGQTVLEGDTNANYTMLNQTSAGAIAGQTKEVKADGTADLLGAQLLLGEGDDVANFNETDADPKTVDSPMDYNALIVGQDALLDGGAGNDVMNVTALDRVAVNTVTTADDAVTAAEEFDWDIDANITGIETANLTIANQIDNATAVAVGDADLENDNSELDGVIIADVMRFDTALTAINLDSQEVRMRQSAATEIWETGQVTEFELFNFREDIALTLKANEVTGVAGGLRVDDTTTDVLLSVDVDGARDHDDVFALDIQAGSESFDLSLMMGSTTTDTVGDAASTTDDDDMLVENVVINLNDSESHAINMNSFGDAGHSDDYVEGSLAVETSLTINDSKDGTEIVVTNVNADTITGMGEADFNITVDAANNYEITTGSGDDVINMIADDVRADNDVDDGPGVDATDEADYVDGGAGTDRLIVSGDDTLGTSNAPISGNTDDDVFEGLVSLEQLEINNDTGAQQANGVVLDEAAQDQTNLQEIFLTGNGAQNTNLTIGENFKNDLSIDASAKDDGVVGVAGAATNLIIESQDSDSDTDLVNLDVKVNLQDGVGIDFENTGDNSADVAITATVSELAAGGTSIYEVDGTGDGEGTFDLRVQQGVVAGQVSEIDSITLVDTDASGVIDAVALNGEQDNDSINVVVSDNWSESAFSFDASAIENNDQDADGDGTVTTAEYDASILTGGLTYNAGLETDAAHTVLGTANNDIFIGGLLGDTFEGNSGDDVAFAGQGGDTLLGGAGDDELHGQEGADTISGGEGDDRIWGNADSDNLTGGAGADAFVYNATSDSDGSQTSTDTITDFQTAGGADTQVDVIEYTLDVTGGVANTNGFVTVNLGRFAQVADLGAGDNSLDGTPTGAPTGGPIYGDGYWATNGGFVLDVDGNGDVTEGDDLQINSAFAIGEGDLNIDVIGSAGNDLIRGGDGVNEIFGNGGDDLFVFVGEIDSAQAAAYQGAAAGIIAGEGIDAVLSVSELTNIKDTSEVRQGDTLLGGAGNDRAVFFGDVDLSVVNNGAVFDVEAGIQYSSVRMTVEQFLGFDTYEFGNTTDHELTIIDVDANGDTKVLSVAEIQEALSGNYSNDADDVNTANQTAGETVTLLDTSGNPVVINGVAITIAQSEALVMGEDDAALVGNVLTNELDANLVSVKSVDNVDGNVGLNIQGEYGNIVINSNGNYNYALGGGSTVANINTLAAGEVVSDQFAYTLQSAGGDESATALVNITITGVNDAAVINNSATAAAGAVVEDALTLTTAGDLNHTDIDNNNANDAWFAEAGNLGFGSYNATAAGAWTYTANNASLQSLDAGVTTTDSFTLTTTDGTTQLVTVTLTGVEDPSTVTAGSTIAGAVAEDGVLTASGDVNSADVDVGDADDAWVVAGGAANNINGFGTYSVTASGAWTYNLNNAAAQALDAGQTTADTFTVTTTDGTAQVVTVTITGQEDQSTVTAGSITIGTVTEDVGLSGTGNVNSLDADANDADDAWTVVAPGAATAFGTYGVTAAGVWTYNLNNGNTAVQALDAGQSATDSFTLSTTDGTQQVITVTILGNEDQSSITSSAAQHAGAVVEDAVAVALGDVDANDVDTGDADDAWFAAAGAASNSGFGSYTVNAGGQWVYNLNNANTAVQALDAGQTTADTFTVATTDGTAQVVTVTITGAEDQSSITSTAGQAAGALTEDAVSAAGDLDSNDVDTGDADDAWNVVAGGASVGGLGTFSVTASGVWTYNVTNAAVQFLDAGVTTQDTFIVSTTDGTNQVVTVTITGVEDAPTIDVAPVFNVNGFSFTASDVDGDVLTLVTPVADGSNAVGNGVASAFNATVGAAAVNDLQITDGASNVDLGVSLIEGTAGADAVNQAAAGESVAIYGFAGADVLAGGAFADFIAGGAGVDAMTGNAGADTFGFAHGDSNDGALDTITDWTSADFIDLSVLGVAGYQESGSDANLAAAQASANAVFAGGTDDIYASAFGGNTLVFVDSDADNIYTVGTDLAFQLSGVNEAAVGFNNFIV